MARTDNDTWDLATSVGATATLVAAARAVATKADDPLIDDRFAEPLVRAVGVDFLTRWAAGEQAREVMRSATEKWRAYGFDLEFSELGYDGDRNDVAAYLASGWASTGRTMSQLLADHGRPTPARGADSVSVADTTYYTSIKQAIT